MGVLGTGRSAPGPALAPAQRTRGNSRPRERRAGMRGKAFGGQLGSKRSDPKISGAACLCGEQPRERRSEAQRRERGEVSAGGSV